MGKEIGEPERMILDGLASGQTQRQVARNYAVVINQCGLSGADWHLVNAAIAKRWTGKTALQRVKEMAWRHLAEIREVSR